MNGYRWLALGLVISICIWMASSVRSQDCEVGTFGCGHSDQHQYLNWKQEESKTSCCHNEDCRPVRARLEDLGWQVWIPEYRMWIDVPRYAIQKPNIFGDGRSHICTADPVNWKRFMQPEDSLPIYCFSPTDIKS